MNFADIALRVKGVALPIISKVKVVSPHVLIVGGVIGLVGAGIYACVKTPEAVDIIDDVAGDIDDVRSDSTCGVRDLVVCYCRGGARIARHYAVPVCIAGLSICAIFGSHKMMVCQIGKWSSAYGLLAESYRRYRNEVVDRYGEDVDRQIYRGEREIMDVDPETGEVKDTSNIDYDPDAPCGVYDIILPYYADDNQITCWSNYFTDYLRLCKHLTLADVRKYFGVQALGGAGVVGWHVETEIDDSGNRVFVSTRGGDTYVNFTIVMREENWTCLRPNVQGYVDDLLEYQLIAK